MNKINLHIIGSETFSNLLDELDINDKINSNKKLKYNNQDTLVRVIFAEQFKIFEIEIYLKDNVPTIFLLKDKDFFKKNNLNLLQFHLSLFLPLEILSFKEILNILLTKYNFFHKSRIIINNYEIDSNQRFIIKNNTKVKLTEKELELILTLNKNNGLKKSFLLKNIWKRSSDLDSHAFETNLHRLRKKINKIFNDKNFIIEKDSLYYLPK